MCQNHLVGIFQDVLATIIESFQGCCWEAFKSELRSSSPRGGDTAVLCKLGPFVSKRLTQPTLDVDLAVINFQRCGRVRHHAVGTK